MINAVQEMPRYYRRLNDYFPAQEMKHPQHLRDLIENLPYYQKTETPDYLVLYAQFHDFLFVDYLLVSAQTRGNGIGSKVIEQLKSDGIPIVLEVEKPDPANPDTVLRRNFYKRHGFVGSPSIRYRRKDKAGAPFELDILYWSPNGKLADQTVMNMMARVCRQVHNHNAADYYDGLPADPQKVLSLLQA